MQPSTESQRLKITTKNLKPFDNESTPGSTASLVIGGAYPSATIQVTGNWSGSDLTVQAQIDGRNWITIDHPQTLTKMSDGTQSAVIPAGATGIWRMNTAGLLGMRITALGDIVPGSGPMVSLLGGAGAVTLGLNLPNTSQKVTLDPAQFQNGLKIPVTLPADTQINATIASEMEIKNDTGNPVPVTGSVTVPLITGFATSAKQLPDNHNVTVSNQLTGFATAAKQLPDGHNVTVANTSPIPVSLASIESRDFIYQQTVAGNSFAFSTGVLNVTSLLGNLRAYIDNPSSNTKTLYIYSVVVDNASSSSVFGSVFLNPTVLPTTSRGTGTNLRLGNATASGATVYADVNGTALSGGTQLPINMLSAGNTRTEFLADDQVIILAPGQKIGMNVPLGLLASANAQIILYALAY